MTKKTTPIWLLDVDGVLNALPNRGGQALPGSWDDYEVITASPRIHDTQKYRITYSPTLTKAIRELHESGVVEVRWLTTWGRGANVELADKIGLPKFEVAGEPDVISGFAGAPAHRWWKFDSARWAHSVEPHRPVIWTDDDLAYVHEARSWCTETGVLFIATQLETGITPAELERITHFIHSQNAMVA